MIFHRLVLDLIRGMKVTQEKLGTTIEVSNLVCCLACVVQFAGLAGGNAWLIGYVVSWEP